MSLNAVTASVLAGSPMFDDQAIAEPASDLRQFLNGAYPDLDFHSSHLDPYWPAIETVHVQRLQAAEESAQHQGARGGFRVGFVVGALFTFAAFTLRGQ